MDIKIGAKFILAFAAAALLAYVGISKAATSSVTDRLTASKSAVEIVSTPAGTDHIGVAVMKTLSGEGVKYGINLPASQKTYTPPAGYPVVDMIAKTAADASIGGWAGRLQTVPGGSQRVELEHLEAERATGAAKATQLATELAAENTLIGQLDAKIAAIKAQLETPAEPPHEPPTEELPGPITEEGPHEPPRTLGGIVGCCWGASELTDLKALGLPAVVRIENPSAASSWEAIGEKVIALENKYSTAGVSGVNSTEYVNKVVTFVRANPHVLAVEVLNEPGGSWFWGSSSESAGNREAYGRLLVAVHEALVTNFGASRPLELASWDGGHDSSNAWGEAWSKNATALADVDGVTSHPYGGTGARATASLGNRKLVESAHAASHKPVYVTELGFPTKGPTGDSLQYTEAEQAKATYGFDAWANTTGYVPVVTTYGYRDSEEGGGYGVVRHNGARKPAFTALQQFIAGQPCTVCN